MGKNEEQSLYRTLDAYQAAFLSTREHKPKLIEQGNKILFAFSDSDKLHRDLFDYHNGARISAIRFTLVVKGLKSRIFSMKKDNETKKRFIPAKDFSRD